MHHVTDKETGNTLTVTDAWLAKHRRLVTVPKSAKPSASRKRASSAEVVAPAADDPSALPDTNE